MQSLIDLSNIHEVYKVIFLSLYVQTSKYLGLN